MRGLWTNGFVALPRRAFDLIGEPTALLVYMAILRRVRHEQGPVMTDRGLLDLDLGQCVIGRDELARLFRTTPDKIRTALSRLKTIGLITTESTSRGTVVSLVEPEPYVSAAPPESPADSPTNPQPIPSKSPTNPQQIPTKDHRPLGPQTTDQSDVAVDAAAPTTRKRKALEVEDRAYAGADFLRDRVLEYQPGNIVGKGPWEGTKGKRRKWAEAFQRLHNRNDSKLNDISWEEIARTVRWLFERIGQEYAFVVLSPDALAKKWDAIQAVRRRGDRQGGAAPASPSSTHEIPTWTGRKASNGSA